MTIIEPNKNPRTINSFLFASVTALVAVSVWSVMIYSQIVGISHDLASAKDDYGNLLAHNAELKNSKYQLTDADSLILAAEKSGLIKVVHPEFLEIDRALVLGGD